MFQEYNRNQMDRDSSWPARIPGCRCSWMQVIRCRHQGHMESMFRCPAANRCHSGKVCISADHLHIRILLPAGRKGCIRHPAKCCHHHIFRPVKPAQYHRHIRGVRKWSCNLPHRYLAVQDRTLRHPLERSHRRMSHSYKQVYTPRWHC